MTKREFLMAISQGLVDDSIKQYAEDALQKMDVSAEKQKEAAAAKRAEKAAAKAPMVEKILACLTNVPKTATDLIVESGVDMTPQAVAYSLREHVNEGHVVKEFVRLEGKKGKVTGYKRG